MAEVKVAEARQQLARLEDELQGRIGSMTLAD
jgi:hypothetical protein